VVVTNNPGGDLVTGVDVEHTKAQLDKAQIENGEVAADRKRYRMSIPANPDRDTDLIIGDALTAAEALVAAVERVQALHEHVTVNTVSYCRVCLTAYPCPTIEALEAS